MRGRRDLRNQLTDLAYGVTGAGQIGRAVSIAQLLPKAIVVGQQSTALDRGQRFERDAM